MELARIEGDEIVIRIKIDTLKEEFVIPDELLFDDFTPRVKVTNCRKFAKELLRELNKEQEDGSTPIHQLFDNAFIAAIDNGAEGVDIFPEPAEED